MKFIVESLTKCGPRLGLLKEFENRPQFTLETPLAMLYTRGGSIPHITHEVFQIVCKNPQIIQIPVVSMYHFQESMEAYEGSISEFIGLKDCVTCMTVQDPGDFTQSGHHYKDFVPLWTRTGKVLLNADMYMRTAEAFKPDIFCFLSDTDTNIASSKKRIIKSISNTLNFLKQCVDLYRKSSALKNAFPIASITGGYSLDARQEVMEEIGKYNEIKGYVIDGLHNNGPEVEFIPFEQIKKVAEFVIKHVSGSKLRVVYGCWNPVTVINLVQLGVDVFDTSYCHIVTERSSALTFAFDDVDDFQQYEINLRQEKYAQDFQPLLPGCTCLTCTKHTRGYVYHLLSVQELLGPLLLTIHNVHHYMSFFEKMRICIKENSLENLKQVIDKQFKTYQHETTKNKNREAIISN